MKHLRKIYLKTKLVIEIISPTTPNSELRTNN